MIITYHGGLFTKLQFADTIVALNPISKQSKLRQTRFGSTIALSSLAHPDTNGFEQVTYGEKEPFMAIGPGEYEVAGTFIKGFGSESHYKGENHINTIYTITLEGMHICVLGAHSTKELPEEALEAIEEVDILFVPVGEGTLDPKDAYKLAFSLEPKIIIPLVLDDREYTTTLKAFLKEAGKEVKEIDKLTLKKKDLEGKRGEVVVLDAVE